MIGLLLLAASAAGAGPGDTLSLANGSIGVRLIRTGREYREEWFAGRAGQMVPVAESGSESRAGLLLGTPHGMVPVPLTEARISGSGASRVLSLRGTLPGATFTKTIEILPRSLFARVSVAMKSDAAMNLGALLSTYALAVRGSPDFSFTPQLRPAPGEVVADHVFRAPAFILQSGGVALALVPDVETIDGKDRLLRSGGDLQVRTDPRPFISFGLMNWKRTKEHVYYVHADSMTSRTEAGTLGYAFFLYANGTAPPREAYRDVVRFQWSQEGCRNFQGARSPQSEPFAAYVAKAWREYLPAIALDTVYRGVPVTLLRQGRLAWSNHLPPSADNDCWFNVWFNALRTAYGMELHGAETGDSALERRAERVLNLALLAPREGGLARTIFYIDSSGGHWVADHAWGGIDGGKNLPMFHNAWTATWMLSWADLLPRRRPEILDYAAGIARFLIAHQEPSGVIPSWYDEATGVPSPVLRDENAETAGAALFLARYALATGDTGSRGGAERAMQYILGTVVPARKWFDFETFFSCSAKPVTFFDSVTGQYPQNTLSMDMAAEACGSMYALTGKSEYVERGSAILDYLCLYQQIWSPGWLSRELFGGFGVQNTDAEWSDARQGYFAVTLMNYYALTGRREYFERGVAALRAMFSLFESPDSPRTAENYGHSGTDAPAGVTGIHWGTGSSVVSIHIIEKEYGGAYVNIRDGWGAGIDGCRIPSVSVSGGKVRVALLDNVGVHRSVLLKFGFTENRSYAVFVNGKSLGRHTSGELERGIDVGL